MGLLLALNSREGLVIPTVHLNGTSKEGLLEQWQTAQQAVTDAVRAVSENGPNARDYYVQDEAAFRLAREQHITRLKMLEIVQSELVTIVEGIDEQRGRS
jgi:hypothetical protein